MRAGKEEDRLLLQGLKAGDEHSFREIYTKYHKQLYSLSMKYLRRRELAEDAVHDVFIKLWRDRKELKMSGSLRGFLFTAAKNHVLNMIAKQKRKLRKNIEYVYETKAAQKEPENIIILSEYRKIYHMAVNQLPKKGAKFLRCEKMMG